MRFDARRTLTLAAVGVAALMYSGCTATKQTEYVAGISTQVQVPRDIRTVRVDVSVGGTNISCRASKVYDGKVLLPRTLGAYPANGTSNGQPVTVTVVGFTETLEDPKHADEYECFKAIRAGDNARILRRSRQSYIQDEVRFLPMALRYSCFDKDCETAGQDKTCKAGRCVDAVIDPEKLPRWRDELLDGSGSTCFSAKECFAAAVPPVIVDPNDCTYAIPNTPSAPPQGDGVPPNPVKSLGDGINVEVTYDGGYNREILDNDPEEGFVIPDPTKPQRFKLAPGLCDLVKGVDDKGAPTNHRITGIRATGLCQAKSPFQPLCTEDQLTQMGTPNYVNPNAPPDDALCKATELKPSKSVLLFVVDDSTEHKIFFEGSDKGALEISLSDPAFQKTEVGVEYFPGSVASSCSFLPDPGISTPDKKGIENALVARDKIVKQLADRGTGAIALSTQADTRVDGALASAYTLLQGDAFKDYNRRGVLLVTNRDWDKHLCGVQTAATLAGNARTAPRSVNTYVVALARRPSEDLNNLPPIPPAAIDIAAQGSVGGIAYDARKAKSNGADAFRKVVEELATCAYDVDDKADPPKDTDVLTYSDPLYVPANPAAKPFESIPFNAGCNSNTATAAGWGRDAGNPRRVRICGEPCTKYREVLKTAAAYAAQTKPPQPAIAVPVFIHKAACAPK